MKPISFATPAATHRGEHDLPFVPGGRPGTTFQLLQVDLATGLWIVRLRLLPGATLERHRHTGDVLAVTIRGAWRYLEYPEVNRAGSYLFEPAGSTHQLQALPGQEGVTDIWFAIHGENLHLDDAGNVVKVRQAREVLETYRAECLARGHGCPAVIGA